MRKQRPREGTWLAQVSQCQTLECKNVQNSNSPHPRLSLHLDLCLHTAELVHMKNREKHRQPPFRRSWYFNWTSEIYNMKCKPSSKHHYFSSKERHLEMKGFWTQPRNAGTISDSESTVQRADPSGRERNLKGHWNLQQHVQHRLHAWDPDQAEQLSAVKSTLYITDMV